MKKLFFSLVFAVVIGCASFAKAADDVVSRAMRDELARSMQKLQLQGLSKPYFIAYRVQESKTISATGSLGSLLASSENRARWLTVELRVGDYGFDNSNYFSTAFARSALARFSYGAPLPLEDNYDEIRRQIWLATDGTYKKALEDLAGKKAALENRTRLENVPDFTREEPLTASDVLPLVSVERTDLEAMVRELSAVFRDSPEIHTSRVQVSVNNGDTRYVNSEGTEFRRSKPFVAFTAFAGTQAADGMPLDDFTCGYGRTLRDLPSRVELAVRLRDMASRLTKLRTAGLVDRYTGPVLFEDQAAAEIFALVFVPKLLASRIPVSDNVQLERSLAQNENSFSDKLGSRVLPSFLTVVDDPTLEQIGGKPSVVQYKADDDGVRSRQTRVVESGVLKTLLTTRTPVEGIEHSTGHRRGGSPLPSNMIVSASKGTATEELRQEFQKILKERGKDYGIVVRRIDNPALRPSDERFFLASIMPTQRSAALVGGLTVVSKLYADGHEEPVRNLEIPELNVSAFRDIVAASSAANVYAEPFSRRAFMFATAFVPAESQPEVISLAVPALLFDEITLRKANRPVSKPPVARSPLAEN